MNKKLVIAALLSLTSGLAAAGGCWQNGKYVMCPNKGAEVAAPAAKISADQTIAVNGCWRNGKYVMC